MQNSESGETTEGYLDRQHEQGCQSSSQGHIPYPEKKNISRLSHIIQTLTISSIDLGNKNQ